MLLNRFGAWSLILFAMFSTLCNAAESKQAFPIEFALTPNYIGTKISIIRSDTSELPESINREAYATIDRARDALVELQSENGMWKTNDGDETILPALALFDGYTPSPLYSNKLQRAISAAQNWFKENANNPWSIKQTKEAAIAINLLAISKLGDTVPPAAIDHLKNISPATLHQLDPIGKYFLIIALAQFDELTLTSFDTIIREQASVDNNDLLPISIIGISRLMRAKSHIPTNDAKAYLRFLSNKLQLGYHNPSPDDEVLSPQLTFLTTIFASSFTNRQLALDTTLFPYDWRNHLANRIIAMQIYCPETGAPYWKKNAGKNEPITSYEALEATSLAIITLTNLAN
ncbi:MAG: hypothetical protein J6V41_05760 [Kiritimatiellae bacterium]|nr:hypothetical protein [Kiritimatiellia bacterium]